MQVALGGLAVLGLALLVPFGLIFVLSRVSGWSTLADLYPLQGDSPRPLVRLGYGVFRGWIGYNGGIVVSANERGLYLAAMPIVLSLCNRPIFIPWSELRAIRMRRTMFWPAYALHTARAPEVDLALRPGTFAPVRPFALRAGVPGDYRVASEGQRAVRG
jgi:hypothetical protein